MGDCIFCQIVTKNAPAHIVYEDDHYLAFLDKFPQTRGHLQLVPKAHYRWVWEIPDIGTFFGVAQKIIRAIIPVLGADHVTLSTRGDEVHHAHLWIVPQYTKVVEIRGGAQSVANLLRRALLN
jgi:histidine triad (HIT) family protein